MNANAYYRPILPQRPISRRYVNLPKRFQAQIIFQECQNKELIGDCWTWTGPLYDGYGRARHPQFKTGKVHRIVYGLLVQPIPDDLETDHLCLNRACVNPDHLEPVTREENLRRSHTTGFGNGSPMNGQRDLSAAIPMMESRRLFKSPPLASSTSSRPKARSST